MALLLFSAGGKYHNFVYSLEKVTWFCENVNFNEFDEHSSNDIGCMMLHHYYVYYMFTVILILFYLGIVHSLSWEPSLRLLLVTTPSSMRLHVITFYQFLSFITFFYTLISDVNGGIVFVKVNDGFHDSEWTIHGQCITKNIYVYTKILHWGKTFWIILVKTLLQILLKNLLHILVKWGNRCCRARAYFFDTFFAMVVMTTQK